jgi:hypothetical protein
MTTANSPSRRSQVAESTPAAPETEMAAVASPTATSTASSRANTRSGKKKAVLRGGTGPASGASKKVAEAAASSVQTQAISTAGAACQGSLVR